MQANATAALARQRTLATTRSAAVRQRQGLYAPRIALNIVSAAGRTKDSPRSWTQPPTLRPIALTRPVPRGVVRPARCCTSWPRRVAAAIATLIQRAAVGRRETRSIRPVQRESVSAESLTARL